MCLNLSKGATQYGSTGMDFKTSIFWAEIKVF